MERTAPQIQFVIAILFNLLVATFAETTNASNLKKSEPVDQIVDPEELESLTTPASSHSYDDWKDWETWEASPDIVNSFPYYRSGYDENGLVVYVVEFGMWDYHNLAIKPEDKIQEFWKYFEQYLRRVERDSAVNNHQGTAFILDYDGFRLVEYASASALQLALKMFTGLVRVNQNFKYGFYINVNFSAETFLNLARPLLGTLLERIDIYGPHSNTWKAKLLNKIPASQLPPKYGGVEGWKALPLNPSRG